MIPSKEQLISQNQWDLFRNKPYENYTIQAAQHTTLNRSIQAMDDMEADERSPRQAKVGLRANGERASRDNYQVMKEAFCVVEDLCNELAKYSTTSIAYQKAKVYLEQLKIS